MSSWLVLFPYAAVVAVLVRTLTTEAIFQEPRDWLERYAADPGHPLLWRKLSYMPTCDFCASFWVSLALVAGLFQYRLVFEDWRGYVVSVFTVMALANVYMAAFSLLRLDLRRDRALADRLEKRKSA